LKDVPKLRRPFVVKVIIAVLSFILGFIAHALWIIRHQIVDVWNNIILVLSGLIKGLAAYNARACVLMPVSQRIRKVDSKSEASEA